MYWPAGIAVDGAGNLHVADSGAVSQLFYVAAEPTSTVHSAPQSQTIASGATAVFTAAASGRGLTFQWTKDGVMLPGATHPSLIIRAAEGRDSGSYGWSMNDESGPVAAGDARLTVGDSAASGSLVSLSVRSEVRAGNRSITLGATIAGGTPDMTMPVFLRAGGSSLNRIEGRGALEDPILTLQRSGRVVAANDDWNGDLEIATRALAVGAFPLESASSKDAAIVAPLVGGTYVAEIAAKGDDFGRTLGEWFDATPEIERGPSTPRLVNLSARKHLSGNGEVLTVGFAISGVTAKTVLIRAIGPSLVPLGVSDALSDPMLQLFAGPTLVRESHDWGGDVQLANITRAVGAFPFMSTDSKDAALLITLHPGTYTLQVRSGTSVGGVVLTEIYEVP